MNNLYTNSASLDKRACDNFYLNEDLLQENAAMHLAYEVMNKFKPGSKIIGVCGAGNNGADVLAALRMLSGKYKASAYLLGFSDKTLTQLNRALAAGVRVLASPSLKQKLTDKENVIKFKNLKRKRLKKAECIIDGIFGSGLNKELDKTFKKAIKKINKTKIHTIACDMPSGLNLDGNIMGACVKADTTISMGALKLGLFSDFAKDYVGEIKVASLGLSDDKFQTPSEFKLLSLSDMRLPIRYKNDTNKGSFGHVFALVGNHPGAAIIALKSALSFGAGLVSAVSKTKLNKPDFIMQTSTPTDRMNAGIIGSGLGESGCESSVIKALAKDTNKALVIDADMFYSKNVLKFINRKSCVLTPHPKEFGSLLKIAKFGEFSIKEVQQNRFKLAREFSTKFKSTLLLKGANTIIAKNGKLYIMALGTNTLAKGGSGDVLSGLIAALLAQGYSPLKAAISASLAHGITAQKYKKSNYSLTPNNIIKGIKCLVRK